ncbi:MAG: NERD domain-containing protein [Bacteroidales bacterium]
MITRLYNPWHITNSGEREADKMLILPSGIEEENFYVIHSFRIASRFHKTRMAGECDFLVLTKAGIMVMEVKGGIIGHGDAGDGNRGFYRLNYDDSRDSMDDPIFQVTGNANAVMNLLRAKNIGNIFVGSMVCFPECEFDSEASQDENLWHRGSETDLPVMILESMKAGIEAFKEKEKAKNVKAPVHWKTLDDEEMQLICDALSPEYNPLVERSRLSLNRAEYERRSEEGLHILRGLAENSRLIIQGPPGSGKSSYAFEIIDRMCRDDGKTCLYLCWNELLAASIRMKIASIEDINPERIKVTPYFDLIMELSAISGDKSFQPTFKTIKKGELRQLVSGLMAKLHKSGKIPKYDFIIADEAQDLFDKGLDTVIKSMLKENNPLQKGNYYLFYDDSQAFPQRRDLDAYVRTKDLFKSSAASFTLFESLRGNTGHGLGGLIRDAAQGTIVASKSYGQDVTFRTWTTEKEAITILKQLVNQEKILGTCTEKNMAVLVAAELLKEDSGFLSEISNDGGFEMLTPENLSIMPEKIRYTTMLKAKGLEWDVVFLVCTTLTDSSKIFQTFIGASRAKCKMFVISKKHDLII